VSNDGEKWEKRTFQNMIKEKFQCWQTEEEHNKTTMFLKLWQFARPLEQVTIPELPEETKKLMCDFADWYHN